MGSTTYRMLLKIKKLIMKETFFFSHDFGARTDPKLQNILMEYGCEGLGIFWCIVEMLYEQGGNLPLHSTKSIAFSIHADLEKVENIVKNSELFVNDGDFFWSESIKNRMLKRTEITEKRRNAGKLGGAPAGNKNAKNKAITSIGTSKNKQLVEINKQKQAIKVKESKVKEIKVKESKVNEIKINEEENTPTENVKNILKNTNAITSVEIIFENLKSDTIWQEQVAMNAGISSEVLKSMYTDFLTHLKATGDDFKTVKDYKAHFSNWVRTIKTKENGNRKTGNNTRFCSQNFEQKKNNATYTDRGASVI